MLQVGYGSRNLRDLVVRKRQALKRCQRRNGFWEFFEPVSVQTQPIDVDKRRNILSTLIAKHIPSIVSTDQDRCIHIEKQIQQVR